LPSDPAQNIRSTIHETRESPIARIGSGLAKGYIASTDNGRTFGFEHTVGPPSPIQWAAQAGQAAFYGDYMGVAATPRHAALVWNVSARPPIPGQTFHQTTWTAIASR